MKVALALSCAAVMSFGGFFSNMSFAYERDWGKVDKNFVRNDKKEIVIDLKNKKTYYDARPSTKMSFEEAIGYCEKMDHLGDKEWRLPGVEELKSLLELSRRDLSVKHAFKHVQEGIYWSSTPDRHEEAWYVDYDLGRYSTATYDHQYYVLCVRESK